MGGADTVPIDNQLGNKRQQKQKVKEMKMQEMQGLGLGAGDPDARVHPLNRQSKSDNITGSAYNPQHDEDEEQILGAQKYRNSGDADVGLGAAFNSSNVVMEPAVDRRQYGRTTNGEIVIKKKKLPKIFNVDKNMSLHKITRRSDADGGQAQRV